MVPATEQTTEDSKCLPATSLWGGGIIFPQLDIERIIGFGQSLELNLSRTEARMMEPRVIELLNLLHDFLDSSIEEQSLPMKYTDRDAGYRPTEEEDPLNVFIRKCRVEGSGEGPLSGMSVGLKDNISVAGIPLTLGTRFLEGYIPDFDATIVTRILDAGGTIVGKMNMESFSIGPGVTGVGDFGRPLNPHKHERVTGGSSSGSASAVAAGYVDLAFGGDQGGSIRIPAAWCGAVGLMATYGLIPHTGVLGVDPAVDYVGPLARRVEDIATVLEVVAGSDGYDPRQIDLPKQLPRYTQALTAGADKLRIGVLSEGFGSQGSEPDVERAVLDALGVLERAGAVLENVSVALHEKAALAMLPFYIEGGKRLFDTNFGGAFTRTYYPTSLIVTFGRFKKSHGHELPLNLKLYLIVAAYLERFYYGRLYAKAHNVRPILAKQYNDAFARVDVLAMPTVPIKAPIYEEPRNEEEIANLVLYGGRPSASLKIVTQNCRPFNLTGHPAMSIPCGKSNGLPIGLMLVAPHFREDLLLRAAYAYQQSVDWTDLFPNAVSGKKGP